MAEKTAFKKLQEDFLGDVFGVQPCEAVRRIPVGKTANFKVKDCIDADRGWIYQCLYKNKVPIASNHPEGLSTHADFLQHATGRVLISGLGLGESLNEVLKNPDVTFVRVIEHEQEIIDLTGPVFGNDKRVQIVHADIFAYTTSERFDCVYHAIWPDAKSARSAVYDRKKLRERFSDICTWQGFIHISRRGGSRPGAGRHAGSRGPTKPRDKKKIVRKGVRYTPKEFDLIQRACKASNRTPSELAVIGSLKEALEILGIEKSEHEALIKKLA